MKRLFPLGLVFLLSVAAGAQVSQRPGATPSSAGAAHRDMAYVAGGHERQKLDLYLPAAGEGPFPLLIWIHGGGWQNGSKEGCPPLRQGYLERGYAVASLNYRLSSHAVFPAQIEDCKAAIRWLRAHAAQYQLDPGRFGVWGSSAGGHLVALLGTSGGVKEFDVGANLEQSSRVQAVCDYYGPTDFAIFASTPGYDSHATDTSPEAKLLGGAVLQNREKARCASPVAYVTPDDPPFLIVHGDKDPVVPLNQSQLLFEALKKAEVSVQLHIIRGAGHGQGFGGPEIEPMAQAFFDRQLKAKAPPTKGEAQTSESQASATPPGKTQAGPPLADRPGDGTQRGRGISFTPQWVTPAVSAPRLQHRTFDSAAAKSKVSYHIYTPEAYDKEAGRRFPVVYWLHGSGGGLPGVAQLAAHFDEAIRAGKAPPLLVVFVNGLPGGMWCDSKDGKTPVETIVMKELLPHIDATFRTLAAREGRLIEGFSMGGYGAARLGFKYPDLFGAVSLLAAGPLQPQLTEAPRVGPVGREQILAAVYGGDQAYFYAQSPWSLAEANAAALRSRTRVRQVVGDQDETFEFNRRFHERLAQLELPHTFTVLPSVAHSPMAVLSALGENNWEFYRAVFGAAVQ